MNRPSLEQQSQLCVAAMTGDSAALNVDSSQQRQLRGGQRRGRREFKTASAPSKTTTAGAATNLIPTISISHSTQLMKGHI